MGTRAMRRERNRAAILQSARELIVERGVDNLSLRDVAARSGYSPAGLYRYFRDKDELVATTAQDALQALSDYFDDVPADLPPLKQVTALGERHLDFARDDPEDFALIFTRLPIQYTTWQQFVAEAWPFRILLEEIRRGIRAGRSAWVRAAARPSLRTGAGPSSTAWRCCAAPGCGAWTSTSTPSIECWSGPTWIR